MCLKMFLMNCSNSDLVFAKLYVNFVMIFLHFSLVFLQMFNFASHNFQTAHIMFYFNFCVKCLFFKISPKSNKRFLYFIICFSF